MHCAQDPAQRPTARQALDALISMDASAHVVGPVRLYPDGHTVPASCTLMALLAAAMPDASALPMLQSIVRHVTDVLAPSAQFRGEMQRHGLAALEAFCIAAYTCDARPFGHSREDSPFYM